MGVGKACLFLSGSSSSSLVSGKVCIQISRRAVLKLLTLGPNLNADLTPSPTQCPEAMLTPPLVKQPCLVLMAFLEQFMYTQCNVMSSKFSLLSVVLYWDLKLPVPIPSLSEVDRAMACRAS